MPSSAAAEQPAFAPSLTVDGLRLSIRERSGPRVTILDLPHLAIAPGECLGVAGPSGAGKTSLLHLLAGLLRPLSGRILWDGTDITALSESARDRWRRETLGMIFQDFALVSQLSVLDNILLPATFTRWRLPAELKGRAAALASAMGLTAMERRAGLLSRGEQQRVALARALLGQPRLILADEPTASLDAGSGQQVIDLLLMAARQSGASLIAVAHDTRLLSRMDRVIRLDQGRLVTEGAP